MKKLKLSHDNFEKVVQQARKVLENGGLLVLPSDTAYGLGANACSEAAVKKIYDFKGRRFGRGLSVFLNNLQIIKKYAEYNQAQWRMVQTLLPGPFTVVLRSKHQVASAIEPGDDTLGIRIVEDPLIKRLTQEVNFPITATSANLSGKGPHYSIPALLKTLSRKKQALVDLVIDAGRLPCRPTSAVVRLVGDQIKVLRKGALNFQPLLTELTQNEAATKKLARKLFQAYFLNELSEKAVVVIMKGGLGAGKTVFAKGIGEIFGLELSSPTFVLLDEVRVNQLPLKTLYHLDLFRLETEAEIKELDLKQFLRKGNLILIEWGEKLAVFESLKSEKASFYLLQFEEKGIKKRQLSLFRI